jgi:hypothetical protein
MVSSGLLQRVVLVRTDVSEEPGASFIRVLTRATRCNNPEDTILHSHRRENLKSYNLNICSNRPSEITLVHTHTSCWPALESLFILIGQDMVVMCPPAHTKRSEVSSCEWVNVVSCPVMQNRTQYVWFLFIVCLHTELQTDFILPSVEFLHLQHILVRFTYRQDNLNCIIS